ncbi:MAG: sulfotransferase [Actinomycetota bacterium]|nr:sulfotransferase [Actinomycetota bacterium]
MFFVVGSARSGTTLVRMMLNAHSDIAVPPESRFIVELWRGQDEVEVDGFLSELEAHKRWSSWETPIESVRAQLPDDSRVSFATAIEAAYRAYARERGKTCWGDKTPRYVESIPLLARLFPTAKFVHQVRDGRNVALSYADVPFGPKNVGKAATLWARRVVAGIRDGRPLGPSRYMELRYEDLVVDAERSVKALCTFLDVRYDSGMLNYTDRAREDILDRAARYNPNLTSKPMSEVRSWADDMPRIQVETFEAVAGDLLDSLEYPRAFPHPSPRARAMAALGSVGLPIGRLRSTR